MVASQPYPHAISAIYGRPRSHDRAEYRIQRMIQENSILRILTTFIYGAIDDLYQKNACFSMEGSSGCAQSVEVSQNKSQPRTGRRDFTSREDTSVSSSKSHLSTFKLNTPCAYLFSKSHISSDYDCSVLPYLHTAYHI